MYDDDAMERATDMVDRLAHDLVSEGEVTPADVRFACRLLEEHYNAAAQDEYGSTAACEFAWRAARNLTELVEEDSDFDWLNAYFVGSGMTEAVKQYDYDADLPQGLDEPRHPDWNGGETSGAVDDVGHALEEFTATADLHLDLDRPLDEIDGMDRAAALSMTFRHIGKRYAADIPDDMLESYASIEVMDVLTGMEDRDDVTTREIVRGGRLLESWLEHRCKKEHAALCIS